MWGNTGTRLKAFVLLVGIIFAAAAHGAPSARAAQNPSPAESKRYFERRELYQKFLDNFRRGPAEQKVAYKAARKYLKKYGKEQDPTNVAVVDYLRNWAGKYEQAVVAYERWKKNKTSGGMGVGTGQLPQGVGTGQGTPPNTGGDPTPPASKQPVGPGTPPRANR